MKEEKEEEKEEEEAIKKEPTLSHVHGRVAIVPIY